MVEPAEAVVEEANLKHHSLHLEGLLPGLERLDRLLERAATAAQNAFGPQAGVDRYRGLYINQAEVERLLARKPGAPALRMEDGEAEESLPDPLNDPSSRLAWLQHAFGLSLFDLDLILIALAPELDRRYERLYAYLQDHVSRRRPGVDLALNLLCPDAAARLARRAHFYPDAPLIRHMLIHLLPELEGDTGSLLTYTLKLDEQIVRFLLHQDGLDSRLAPFCELVVSGESLGELPLSGEVQQTLPGLVDRACEESWSLRLYFQGPPGAGKRQAAEALAGQVDLPLLVVDLGRALDARTDWQQVLRLVFRFVWFQDAILYLEGLDAVRCDAWPAKYERLLDALANDDGITILAGTQPWLPSRHHPLGVRTVPFPIPDFDRRRHYWQASLAAADLNLAPSELDALAGRFRLTPGQIAEAVAVALNTITSYQQTMNDLPILDDLFAAARAQSGHDLATLAQKIDPLYTWDDIVLPADSLAQLHEICQRVAQRRRVLGEWGFDQKLSLGKGVNALFAGPSGTGKTMAAEIIANELGLDLYKIDLAGVVSKYIGETEKNLDRIFRAAENANAILFFDEADALFGKRSEVRDSHDRYANIEISYLLQKMEAYDGLAILTTNMRQHLDEAFIRRLAFTVHFPFPDEASRRRIWAGIWPAATPLAETVDLDFMASEFKLSGGNIKNNALAAAYLAAAADSPVGMEHLLQATRREYQKMGKTVSETELNELYEQAQLEQRVLV